jgi:hypothetical protein
MKCEDHFLMRAKGGAALNITNDFFTSSFFYFPDYSFASFVLGPPEHEFSA